jgi:hypothetical protein
MTHKELLIELKPLWRENLIHMLGAGSHIPEEQHGCRNQFCASLGSEDHISMLQMEVAGFVVKGRRLNGDMQFFYATKAGCEAVGLGKAAIKRALEIWPIKNCCDTLKPLAGCCAALGREPT